MSRGVQALPQVQMRVAQAGAGEPNFVAPEKLISGNPKQTAWVQHASADGRFVGTWELLQPTLKRFVIDESDA